MVAPVVQAQLSNPDPTWDKTFYYLVDTNCNGKADVGQDQIVVVKLDEPNPAIGEEKGQYRLSVQSFGSDGSGAISEPFEKQFIVSKEQVQKQQSVFSGLLTDEDAPCAKHCSVFYDGSIFISSAPVEVDQATGLSQPVQVDYQDLLDYYPEVLGDGKWPTADQIVVGN